MGWTVIAIPDDVQFAFESLEDARKCRVLSENGKERRLTKSDRKWYDRMLTATSDHIVEKTVALASIHKSASNPLPGRISAFLASDLNSPSLHTKDIATKALGQINDSPAATHPSDPITQAMLHTYRTTSDSAERESAWRYLTTPATPANG